MILIIAHHYDQEAKWLYQSLTRKRRKLGARLLIPEALGIDYDITLHLTNYKTNAIVYFYENARQISSEDVTFLVNRLNYIDPIVWNKSDEKEKTYAASEINAFFAAFIYSFSCPVINGIENGSIYGNNTGILYLIGALKKNGILIHPDVPEENGKSFQRVQDSLNGYYRMMFLENKVFVDPDKNNAELKNILKKSLRHNYASQPLELYFTESNRAFELVHISRTPSIFVYQKTLLPYLLKLIKNSSHDPDNRNTE